MQININRPFEVEQSLSKWALPLFISVLAHIIFLLNIHKSQNQTSQTFAMQSHKTSFSVASQNPTKTTTQKVEKPQSTPTKGVTQTKKQEQTQTHEMIDSTPVLSQSEVGEISIKPHYPARAIENNWQGKSVLLVKVINGITSQIVVEKTSGYKILDNSAINAIKQIKAPSHIQLSEYWIRIPIQFVIA